MTAARNCIMDKIWICTAKKQVGKLPKGASAEVIKHGTTAAPNDKEITAAFETKYAVKIPNGLANKSNFELIAK